MTRLSDSQQKKKKEKKKENLPNNNGNMKVMGKIILIGTRLGMAGGKVIDLELWKKNENFTILTNDICIN